MMIRTGLILSIMSAFMVMSGACSSNPEIDPLELERADVSILEAKQYGAEDHAPRSLALAEERLALARKRLASGEADSAVRMLREAQVLAELAAAESLARQSEAALRIVQESLAALERELGHTGEP